MKLDPWSGARLIMDEKSVARSLLSKRISCPGGIFLAILLLCSSVVSGQTLVRPTPRKPTRAEMLAMLTTGRVVVKFREGSGVMLRGGQFAGAPSAELAGLE